MLDGEFRYSPPSWDAGFRQYPSNKPMRIESGIAMNPHRSAEQRIILIGASNLARAFPLAITSLTRGLAGPLEILAALGYGRSLGAWSRIPGRALPGIIECGLWSNLEIPGGDGPPPLAAIVDVGNDLVYGTEVARILGWLECCLERLRRQQSEIVLMSLPLGSLARLTPQRFELLRKVLFPGFPIHWPLLQERIAEFDDGMRLLGRQYGVHWVEAPADWYGFDPIHIRRQDRPRAWESVFAHWQGWAPSAPAQCPAWTEALALRRLRPAERYFFGYHQLTPQPVLARPELRISLF
jgi:hypothetical protein